MKTTCGRPTESGTPCKRRTSGGPCRDHSEAGVEARKLVFLAAYEKAGTVVDAAKVANVHPSTPHRWRLSDPDFAEKLHRLEVLAEADWYERIESSLYRRCADGTASATEVIFALTNMSRRRGDDRWKHRREVELSGKLGIYSRIMRLDPDEVERILNLPDDKQEAELRRLLEWPRDDRESRGGTGDPA